MHLIIGRICPTVYEDCWHPSPRPIHGVLGACRTPTRSVAAVGFSSSTPSRSSWQRSLRVTRRRARVDVRRTPRRRSSCSSPRSRSPDATCRPTARTLTGRIRTMSATKSEWRSATPADRIAYRTQCTVRWPIRSSDRSTNSRARSSSGGSTGVRSANERVGAALRRQLYT